MSLTDILKKRKKRKEMEDGNLQNHILHSLISDTVSELTNEEFKKNFDRLKKEIEDKTENEVKEKLERIENEAKKQVDLILSDLKDGDKGEKGDSPTKTFLTNLIKPLIPNPQIGKKGDKGDRGDNGDKGEKGDKGDDGSPDKPKDIVKKLNTLENVLEVKVLKGLKPILQSIQSSMRSISKGGGMGLPIHETFAVDSTTTSITLSYNVAANGRAIFGLRYQGQTLHWGEHYTISGKVITILETLTDNTNLDISYIRK